MYRVAVGQQLILASSSPRRAEMLSSLGLEFMVITPAISEDARNGEAVSDLVTRLASEKALAVARTYPAAWVLGADTVVVVDESVLGKPLSSEHAREMLRSLQGRKHQVVGGMALINESHQYQKSLCDLTEVEMMTLSDQQINAYIDTGEPFDKAGAYAIQGFGGHFIERIAGSYTNVVGLNLADALALLKDAGVVEVVSVRTKGPA